jgi:hypothetical protein
MNWRYELRFDNGDNTQSLLTSRRTAPYTHLP